MDLQLVCQACLAVQGTYNPTMSVVITHQEAAQVPEQGLKLGYTVIIGFLSTTNLQAGGLKIESLGALRSKVSTY